MGTTATFHSTQPHRDGNAVGQCWLALFVHAALPLGLFGLIHLCAEAMVLLPFFFTPFGLPNWVGATAHLLQLSLVGAAYWAVTERRSTSRARHWLAALSAAYIALPFLTPFLDSLLLAVTCTMIFLLAAATAFRAAAVSRLAGWLLAPLLAMVGLSAAMGLAVAAYAPPFALTQTQQAPPAT